MTSTTGITVRHARKCPSRSGGDCPDNARRGCKPSYQAHVWDRRERRRIRKTFTTLSEAKGWRQDAIPALRKGTMRAPSKLTLREAWETWLSGARNGTVHTRSGDDYKPSALRGYETAMRLRILPDLGGLRLSDVSRLQLQDLADQWLAAGLDASTIRNSLMPIRAIFRRALSRGDIVVNPTAGLELPAVRGRRERRATPEEAALLIGALPEGDRALWATALYAGLRSGELRALRWEDIDLPAGIIRVERSWDQQAGEIEPKSRAGTRTVPIASVLREHLIAHRLRSGRAIGLAFGRDADRPFTTTCVYDRAAKAWSTLNAERAENELDALESIGLHECRHTFASLMIAAGVNAKALSTYMGHASITITLDRYGHLMPGNEKDAAGLLDTYLRDNCATVATVV